MIKKYVVYYFAIFGLLHALVSLLFVHDIYEQIEALEYCPKCYTIADSIPSNIFLAIYLLGTFWYLFHALHIHWEYPITRIQYHVLYFFILIVSSLPLYIFLRNIHDEFTEFIWWYLILLIVNAINISIFALLLTKKTKNAILVME